MKKETPFFFSFFKNITLFCQSSISCKKEMTQKRVSTKTKIEKNILSTIIIEEVYWLPFHDKADMCNLETKIDRLNKTRSPSTSYIPPNRACIWTLMNLRCILQIAISKERRRRRGGGVLCKNLPMVSS